MGVCSNRGTGTGSELRSEAHSPDSVRGAAKAVQPAYLRKPVHAAAFFHSDVCACGANKEDDGSAKTGSFGKSFSKGRRIAALDKGLQRFGRGVTF